MARREREAGSTPLELGGHLDAATALGAIAASRPLTLEAGAAERIDAAAKRVADAVAKDERVYGITTGFGSNADRTIPPDEVERLQENLLVSHAFGDGPLLPDPTVRLAWLLRIHALAQGSSGIRRSTIEAMMRLHAAGIVAEVPARGSVGASGDLAPLAFLALPLIGRGRVRVDGREVLVNWTRHGPTEDKVELDLEAGRHAIEIEHMEIDGWAWLEAHLERVP